MDLRVLRYFLAIADTGSTSAAAHALNTSQPSLWRQVRELERELGTSLFEPGRGRLRLSPAGRRLVPLARDIAARADDVPRMVNVPAVVAPIHVVAPLVFIADVLAPFLAEPEAAGTIVYPREVVPSEAIRVLDAGDADLAVSSWPVPDRFATQILTRPPVWAYVPAGHRLSKRRAVELPEIVEEPLIVLEQEHGTRRVFDEAALAAGVSYQPNLVTNLAVVAMALAAAGHGVAIVTEEPRFGLHQVAVRQRHSPVQLAMTAAWEPSRYSTPAVERFVGLFAAYCRRTRPS